MKMRLITAPQLLGNVRRNIASPPLGGIEADDPRGVVVLPPPVDR
jgi:hypothetical protein